MHRAYDSDKQVVFWFMAGIADNRDDPKEKRRGKSMIQMIRQRLRSLTADQNDTAVVHFHQGPQGQPTPCFEDSCPNPRLSV
jgi:hypothetical protein